MDYRENVRTAVWSRKQLAKQLIERGCTLAAAAAAKCWKTFDLTGLKCRDNLWLQQVVPCYGPSQKNYHCASSCTHAVPPGPT
jgi:hypothetical protein